MGPISIIKKPQWGWVLIFSMVLLGFTACGGNGVQSFTLKAQFVSEASPEGSSQLITPKNQIINQCQVACETALLTGEDTDLLQLPTNHVVDCDENQVPVNGSEITIVEGVSLKTQDEFLTVQVCCNPLATGNILNDLDLFNFLGFCGDLRFSPASCADGCELDVGLNATSAEDVASLGCFVINAAFLALSPFIEGEDSSSFTCTLFSLLKTGSVLAECAPPPENIASLCNVGGDDSGFACGDGIVQNTDGATEECDGGEGMQSEADQSCKDLLQDESALCAADNCMCFTPETACGNGVLDSGEECDPFIFVGEPGNDCGSNSKCSPGEIEGGDACTCIDCSGFTCEGASPDGTCTNKEGLCSNCPEDCTMGEVELCDNGADDDGDGDVDCDDADCFESSKCQEGGNSCGNSICDSCENAKGCSFDCGSPGTCGDGTCGLLENYDLCPEDCLDLRIICNLPLGPSCMEVNCDCESAVGMGSICDGNCCTPLPGCGNGYHDQQIGEECDFVSGRSGTEPVGCDFGGGEICGEIGTRDECTCVIPIATP